MNEMQRQMILSNIDKIDFENEHDPLLKIVEPQLENAEIGIFYGNGQLDICTTWHWIKWKDFGWVSGEEHKKVVGYLTKEKLIELLEK